MRILILILIFVSTELFAQQKEEWVNMLEHPEFPRSDELKPENVLSNYFDLDFSDVLKPKTQILGYIGSKYQRIHVSFSSIRKSKTGHTMADSNSRAKPITQSQLQLLAGPLSLIQNEENTLNTDYSSSLDCFCLKKESY